MTRVQLKTRVRRNDSSLLLRLESFLRDSDVCKYTQFQTVHVHIARQTRPQHTAHVCNQCQHCMPIAGSCYLDSSSLVRQVGTTNCGSMSYQTRELLVKQQLPDQTMYSIHHARHGPLRSPQQFRSKNNMFHRQGCHLDDSWCGSGTFVVRDFKYECIHFILSIIILLPLRKAVLNNIACATLMGLVQSPVKVNSSLSARSSPRPIENPGSSTSTVVVEIAFFSYSKART